MSIESDDLANLRDTTSKLLIGALWTHVPIAIAVGMLRVVVADMQSYDVFYKKLIATVPLKNVTSRFAMEKIKSTTALPIP